MEVGTRILIHGLVKQTQFCVSCVALWSQNGRFQTPPSFQIFNRCLFRPSPVVMNLRWRLKKYCQKNKRRRWDICEEFSMWHLVTKSTDLKSVMPRMSSHLPDSREISYVSSAVCPECFGKEWWNKSFGLQPTPKGKRPRGRPRTRCLDYISDLAWSRFGLEPAELSGIAVDCEVFRVLLGLLPPRISQRKSGHKIEWINECVGLHWNFLFMKLSLVCLPNVNVVFK